MPSSIELLKPTVEDVSTLLRTRTVAGVAQGLGGDTGPADVTVFDETTRPKASEVQKLIDLAYGSIEGRQPFVTPAGVPAQAIGGFRLAAAAYAAVLVEQSFFRETMTAESIAFWTGIMDRELAALQKRKDDAKADAGYGFGMLTIGTTRRPVTTGLDVDLPGLRVMIDSDGYPYIAVTP
jgi:hypothetical protein